jgi:hypothetical protein
LELWYVIYWIIKGLTNDIIKIFLTEGWRYILFSRNYELIWII